MWILLRACVILVLALAILPERPSATAGASGLSASDSRILQSAATRAGSQSPSEVVRWLRGQTGVETARLGLDHQTISVAFRDGARSMILPKSMPNESLSLTSFRPLSSTHQTVRRALVMEPFAWQMGPTAGVEEIRVLKAAGFQVDTLYNEQVTIQAMKSMSKYDLVYIHTHGGVNEYGEAVIESGQADLGPDPTLDQMINNYEVFATPIAGGNDTKYYGIMSRFILDDVGQFPANSMMVVNTCSLLQGWLFWKALQIKGLSTLVSYDEEPILPDALQAGDRLFDDLGTGINISQAIAHADGSAQYGVGPPGYGVTKPDPSAQYVRGATGVAHLGYLGDGLVTLAGRSSGPLAAPAYASPTPTPTPAPTSAATSTPTPTPAPTSTPTPTTVPTPSVLPLQVRLKHSVTPGSNQVITVRSLPHIAVHFQVVYPNGDVQQADGTTDAQGAAVYQYVQHGSKIGLHAYTAHVRVTVTNGTQTRGFRRTYQIGFGRIDVSVTPPAVEGKPINVWVHTRPHVRVTAALFVGSALLGRLTAVTGAQGWGHVQYRPPALHNVLTKRRVMVRAWVEDGGETVGTRTYFVMP